MELFSISCTTCKTRLKVRDEAAIGKILDCPRCGAFVLVEPPPGWRGDAASNGAAQHAAGQAEPEPSADDSARWAAAPPPPAETTFDDAVSLFSDSVAEPEAAFAAAPPTAAPPTAAPPTAAPPTAAIAVEPMAPPTPSQPEGTTAAALIPPVSLSSPGASVVEQAASASSASEAAQVASELAGASASTLPQWLLLGGAAVAGIALALVAFVFAVWMLSGGERRPAVASAPPVAAQRGSPPGDAPAAAEQADANPAAAPTKTPAKTASPPAAKPTAADAGEKPGPEKVAPLPKAEIKKPQKPKEPAEPELPAKKPTPADVAAEPRPAETVDTKTVSGALEKFAPFLDDPSLPAGDAPADAAADKPAAPTDLEATGRSEESARPRPEPRKVDVPARLADKLPQVEFQDVPLIDFLAFASDLSTIPITLDPEALQFAAVTPERPVSVKLREASVGEMLKVALAPLGLAYEISSSGIVVLKAPPADGKPRSINYAVGDLGGNDAEGLALLAAWAAELVAPETWAPAGAGTLGTNAEKALLVVQQGEAGHFLMLQFCEKLRVARGISPRSKFDRSLFRLEPRVSRGAAKLATPITLNYSQPAPLVRILDRLAKTAGVRILVDWDAAAVAGWSPDAEATVVASKLPLSETLVSLLRPMDLTYRVVDDGIVQVTTPRALEARLELEFYSVADLLTGGLDGERLAERIKVGLGEELFPESGPGGTIRFDPPSKHLLVLLPQSKHAELVKLLAEWRAK